MPVWTASQKFSPPQWGSVFKELWGRPTTTADFRSSFRQILWGRRRLSRSCAGWVAWWSSCRAQCAARSASGRRSGRRRGRTGRSRKGGRRNQGETLMDADGMKTQEHLEPWGACDTDIKKCTELRALRAVLTGCATCACWCLCHSCWCSLCHACCPHRSCWYSCCKCTVFVDIFCSWRCTLYTICLPQRKRSCFWAFCSSRLDASQDRQPGIQSFILRDDTNNADFGSSFRQIHYTSRVYLLEDKIQDWGMYLLTISYRSYAVDQRSGRCKMEKSYTENFLRHLNWLRRFPLNIIGCKSWTQKLMEVLKTLNKPNQRPKIQLSEQETCFVRATIRFEIRDASQDRQLEIQSSLASEDIQRILMQSKNWRFRNFILTNAPRWQHSLVGRWDSRLRYVFVDNFLRKLWIGSKKWRWLTQWMIQCPRHLWEEFECQILNCSIRGLFQHWTESSTIPGSRKRSVWRLWKFTKQTRLRKTDCLLDLWRANDSVENYADLFTIGLRNDDIQEFDSKWDGILLSMTKIPPDEILEGLYKLRIRESEKLKTVLELCDVEIHQKKLGPDYHWLKNMVKRSSKIYEIGILAPEMELMNGLTLNQEFNSIKRTQWQKD